MFDKSSREAVLDSSICLGTLSFFNIWGILSYSGLGFPMGSSLILVFFLFCDLQKDDLDQLSLRTSSMHLSDAIDNLDNLGGMGSGGRGGLQMDSLGTPWGMGGGNGPPIQSGRRGGPEDHFDMGGLNVAPNGPIGGNSFMNAPQRGGSGSGGGFPGNSGGFPGAGNPLSNNMMGNPNLGGGGGGGMNPMLQKMLSQQQQPPPVPALQFPFNSNNVSLKFSIPYSKTELV